MAGANMNGGQAAPTSTVPTMGSLSGRADIAGNVGNEPRAEGVNYNTNESIGVDLDTGGYPAGTNFGEASNPLRP